MLSLIKEYELPSVFPEKVVKEAKEYGTKIDKKEMKNRKDLREEFIVTIDGEDAKDLDDAVKVKKLENDNYQLQVHIADVSYYVKENSLLDREAVVRGTSIYMLDRVIPMLPKELSNGICSLNQGEDRFALTVLMEIDQNGKVISSDIQKVSSAESGKNSGSTGDAGNGGKVYELSLASMYSEAVEIWGVVGVAVHAGKG